MRESSITAGVFILLTGCTAQQELLEPQTDVWNSSFKLTSAQIAAANISAATAHNVEIALEFERTNNAGSLVQDDPFYALPDGYEPSTAPPPGTMLKIEEHTNTSLYNIPPSLSMSRFLYTTETLNGTSIPASAYVLWPYMPRRFKWLERCSGERHHNTPVFPVVALAHGTSGQTQACAPSGLRDLWDGFHTPFPPALAGYAVIAPDYAGLGVANTTSPYFVLPSQANDLVHAVKAAQSHWLHLLSKEFVVAGQSQGGAVAWSTAQRQVERPVDGYLGTVALSPFTDVLADIAADAQAENNARVAGIAQGLNSVLDSFKLSDWLTDAGIARLRLLQEIKGCGVSGGQLFGGEGGTVKILKDGWNLTMAAEWYQNVSANGGKPFAGPMLVLQGTEDPNANEPVTTTSVQQTCRMFPNKYLHYIRWEGITHVPVLYAAQHLYLDWIADRFNHVPLHEVCTQETVSPVRGIASMTKEEHWILEFGISGL